MISMLSTLTMLNDKYVEHAHNHLYSMRDISILRVSYSIPFVTKLSDLRIVQLLSAPYICLSSAHYLKTNP